MLYIKIKTSLETSAKCQTLLDHLVEYFNNMFSIFKQYYTYFYTLFHPHIFSKNTKNVVKTTLPNESTVVGVVCLSWESVEFIIQVN